MVVGATAGRVTRPLLCQPLVRRLTAAVGAAPVFILLPFSAMAQESGGTWSDPNPIFIGIAGVAVLATAFLVVRMAALRRELRRTHTRLTDIEALVGGLPAAVFRTGVAGFRRIDRGETAGVPFGAVRSVADLVAHFDPEDRNAVEALVVPAGVDKAEGAGSRALTGIRMADGRSVDLRFVVLQQTGGSEGEDASDRDRLIVITDAADHAVRLRLAEEATAATERQFESAKSDARLTGAMLSHAPVPIWLRDADGRLLAVNETYADAVGEPVSTVIERQIELATAPMADASRQLAAEARSQPDRPVFRDLPIVVAGERRFQRLCEKSLPGIDAAGAGGTASTIGFALDRTDADHAARELDRHIKAHADVLESLHTAIAVFGPDKRLQFFNHSYLQLWALDEAWLNSGPTLGELLDELRAKRKLPEYVDYKGFRREQLDLFTSLLEPQETLLHLPDGTTLRSIVTPHPLGGLMFLLEDVTSALTLERNYNTLMAVQRESLDNLSEGIAVFGGDGRLQLSNPAFSRLWGLAAEEVASRPHIAHFIEETRGYYITDGDWSGYRERMIARALDREPGRMRLPRADGTVLDYRTVPLPDGGVLNSYLDVTDSATVEQALRASNQALEAADRLKSEFTANVSYQLRTPLNAIMGFAEILDKEYFGELNGRQREYTGSIVEASRRLLSLINDILDIATIEAGYMELELDKVDVRRMIQSVHDLTREWAGNQSLQMLLDCPDEVGSIRADERRLKQALYNLVSNAVKFTPPSGQITLSARREGREVHLIVSDTGVGIPFQDQERVFGRFERGVSPTRRTGVGLGLALVKSFIELHGGRVALKSEPGVGTTVRCILPDHPIAALIPTTNGDSPEPQRAAQ